MTDQLLKLKARDEEDVQVVSAVLQDSIAPISDMTFRSDDKNFIMVVHRLRREAPGEDMKLERICCAVNVQGVQAVKMQGIDLTQQGRMLDLLAAILDGPSLTFIFAGGARIRLELAEGSMIVEDFGEAWPAQCNPCHDSDRQAG